MDYLATAAGGLLELTLPWVTLTGQSPEPGHLGRLGPITPTQASYLADLATRDPAARWRIIVTGPDGRAVAVARLTSPTRRMGKAQPGLVGQVTVIIGPECLAEPQQTAGAGLPPIQARLLAAASAAAAQAASDVPGGCAHAKATEAYRPTRQLWEYVAVRDLTCRFQTCRQPATRCDLDHTVPYDQGGITCSCNLGSVCRCHHKVKQHRGWHLDQPTPGTFTWTTRTGRTYTTRSDSYTT